MECYSASKHVHRGLYRHGTVSDKVTSLDCQAVRWCCDVLQVYLASASPPVRFPNVYGVDLPSKKEFVATDLSEDQICKVVCPQRLPDR